MKTKLFFGSLVVVASLTGVITPVAAEGYEYDINSRITLDKTSQVSIETNVKATANGKSGVPGVLRLPLYGTQPQNVEAKDRNGKALPVDIVDDSVSVRLNSIQANSSDVWLVSLSYIANEGLNVGGSNVFMAPKFDYADINVASESLSIVSDVSLGNFVTRGQMPSNSNTAGDNFLTTWENKRGALSSSVGLLFGDNAVLELEFDKTLQNDGYWWKSESFVLPPDTNQQKVFIDSIEPQPNSVGLDTDGNVIVEYRIGPRQSVEVKAKIRIATNSYTYALEDNNLLINDIDPVLVEQYTVLNDTWIDTSLEFSDVINKPVVELVEEIYDRVATEYSKPQGEDSFSITASRANSLIGELRANGIPARLVAGAVFGDGARILDNPLSHAWVEVNIPGVGWITIDPNFEQNGDYFGVADIQRVALALRGFDPGYPPENITNFKIGFVDTEPPSIPVMKPDITGTKYMVLPGFSVDVVNLKMPGGVIVDNTRIVIGDMPATILGSLAPHQSVSLRSTSVLAGAFTSESVQYGVFDGGPILEGSDILSQATINVSYSPMIILALAILSLFIIRKWLWPLLRRVASRGGKSEESKKDKHTTITMSEDKVGDQIENVDMLASLDLPEDDYPEDAEPQDNVPAPAIAPDSMKPIAPDRLKQPQPKPVNNLSLDEAEAASSVRVRREIRKKQHSSRRKLVQ